MSYLTLPDGGVYSADIEVTPVEGGLKFTSPVDGHTVTVDNINVTTLCGKWFDSEHYSDIMDCIAEMGGCRWVVGETTEYNFYSENGKHYLNVHERVDKGIVAR